MDVPADDNVHIITQYRDDGKSEFVPLADQTKPEMHAIEGCGVVQDLYQTVGFPPDVADNGQDVAASIQMRKEGLLDTGRITVDGGMISEIVHIQPGGSSPMHRTRTLDLAVVVDGSVELELDNGDKRTFKQGDSIVLRGAGHKWMNHSARWVKLFSATIDAAPIVVNGKTLEETWEL